MHGYDAEFVESIYQYARGVPGACPIIAISGLQGTGKSTLSAQLCARAGEDGINAVAVSIDDFYLTRPERTALARQIHPLLATRGPPGTHDIELAIRTLDALKRGAASIPVFDKIADERLALPQWRHVSRAAGLIFFEGWFLGTTPQADSELAEAVNSLERDKDADQVWRRYCNHALAGYAPLWQLFDRLILLQGPGFAQVRQWRWQQEQSLQALNPTRSAMTQAQVEEFILYFQRVSQLVLEQVPARADWIIELDAQRRVVRSQLRHGQQ